MIVTRVEEAAVGIAEMSKFDAARIFDDLTNRHALGKQVIAQGGDIEVFDVATGERLLVLDGPTVTARRTAAVSLLAAQCLAPNPDGPLLVVSVWMLFRPLDGSLPVVGVVGQLQLRGADGVVPHGELAMVKLFDCDEANGTYDIVSTAATKCGRSSAILPIQSIFARSKRVTSRLS